MRFFGLILFISLVCSTNMIGEAKDKISDLESQLAVAPAKDKYSLYLQLSTAYAKTNFTKALTNARLAQDYARQQRNAELQAQAAEQMALLYESSNDVRNALKYYQEELDLRLKMPVTDRVTWLYFHMAELYGSDSKRASDLYEKCLPFTTKLGNKGQLLFLYKALYKSYNDRGKLKEALGYLKLYDNLKESFSKKNNEKKVSRLMNDFGKQTKEKNYEINKLSTLNDFQKQEIYKKELDISRKKLLIEAADHERRVFVIILICGVLFIALLIFLIWSIRNSSRKLEAQYHQIQNQKEEIQSQRNELAINYIKLEDNFKELKQQKEEITSQRDEIEEKSIIIREYNKELTQSIQYALKIQEALLPPMEEIKAALPGSFILYRPKDVVSGDFYWMSQTADNRVFIAVADCTGHGVPGGFMSMIGIEKLEEISAMSGSLHPAEMLTELDRRIKKSLRQNSPTASSAFDGMDIALCEFNKNTGEVLFCGANRPLWVYGANNKLNEYPPVKRGIGGRYEILLEFTNQKIELNPNDMLYMFSDGYADQFGGEKKSKLSRKNFRNLLSRTYMLETDKQQEHLNNFFDTWKADESQLDDVLVMGIRYLQS
jgi:serine phosphatase RsbU (regulator of sigma subunit)